MEISCLNFRTVSGKKFALEYFIGMQHLNDFMLIWHYVNTNSMH